MAVQDNAITDHFTVLIYPFRHRISESHRARRLEQLSGRWLPWWSRFDVKEVERLLDDSYFFLPFVREQLFPETKRLPQHGTSKWESAVHWLATQRSLAAFADSLGSEAVLRLTYSPERLDELRPLRLVYRRRESHKMEFEADFHLSWIDAILFPQQIGLLAMMVRLPDTDLSVARLNDFLYFVRAIHPPKLGWTMSQWVSNAEGYQQSRSARDLVDSLLADLAVDNDGQEDWSDRASRRDGKAYTLSPEGQTYGQHFHLYSYACFAEDSITHVEAVGEVWTPSVGGDTSRSTENPLASDFERSLYELATCTRSDHPDWTPHFSYVARLLERHRVAIWGNWQAMALQDNVVFLGRRPSKFTREALPRNVLHDYLNLYLLTIYQKMRLSVFSGELQRSTARIYGNLGDARKLWADFILFRNHFWFSEVTRGFQGTELYRRFGEGQSIRALFDEVSHEVAQLQEFFEQQAQRQTDAMLNVLTLIMLPFSILVTVFSAHLVKSATWSEALVTTALSYLPILAAWLLIKRPWN